MGAAKPEAPFRQDFPPDFVCGERQREEAESAQAADDFSRWRVKIRGKSGGTRSTRPPDIRDFLCVHAQQDAASAPAYNAKYIHNAFK
jgi:hypothetical protein